jgi:hypothetical protein
MGGTDGVLLTERILVSADIASTAEAIGSLVPVSTTGMFKTTAICYRSKSVCLSLLARCSHRCSAEREIILPTSKLAVALQEELANGHRARRDVASGAIDERCRTQTRWTRLGSFSVR